MDSRDAKKIVHERIFKLEPENVARKIIGYIYLQDLPDHEMIRLALGSDNVIQNLIQTAKTALFLASTSPPISPTMIPSPLSSDHSIQYDPFSHSSPRPALFQRVAPHWDSPIVTQPQPVHIPGFNIHEEYNNRFLNTEDDSLETVKPGNDYYCSEVVFNHLGIRGSRNSPNLIDYPVKTCHYFKQGFCKHGNNCRYFHGESFPESYPSMFDSNSFDISGEEQLLSVGSLEKLEMEITELLKSRNGYPVSIAALPMMYYEKYGRTLQAEGYLTESQRHGKAGYSLTKLLARLNGSIQLIDRPHGQHAVILAEDAPKYMDIRGDRNDPGPIVSGSRQIYLTFPADSTFTEEDVSNYFNTIGQVQDVRIPCQQKRMFGFVTFLSAETVKLILSKGNPHYVCGARVLVKPYREKSKLVERKYQENFEHPMAYHLRQADFDPELHAMWLRRRLIEAREHAIELEAMRLSQLQFAHKSLVNHSGLGYSMDERKFSEDSSKFPTAERFNYLFDVFGPSSNDNQESTKGLNLPESPFAPAVASSISAVM